MKRTILITGATSGFGCSLVKAFLSHGDQVIATGRNLLDRSEVFKAERGLYPNLITEINLDVTLPEDLENLKKYLTKSQIQIDILINNAGYGLFGALEDLSMEKIRHQFEVNFFGLVSLTQSICPFMVKDNGKIFNFSSVFGITRFPLTSIYCASKFAVEGFSESLDYELRPHGIQVCLIEPGGYRTKFGASTVWGSNKNLRYERQTQNYHALQCKLANRKKFQDPEDLALGVYRLSLMRNLPLRVPFGKDAKMTAWLKKLLPSALLHRLTHLLLNKVFLKKVASAN
jgi:short-subunit dehydrogenase